jgi:hypothetical protein
MIAKPRAIVNKRGVATRSSLSRAVLVLVGFVLTAALMPVSSAAASRKTIPDVKVLFHRAVKIVRATDPPTFSNAVMLEAEGTTGGVPTTSASGIDRWRFVFDNQLSGPQFPRSAFISYGPPPLAFGPVTGNPSPFLEDRQIPKAPAMTLKRAVKLLQGAGFTDAFLNVTLRSPIAQITFNPLYIFGFGNNQFVAVDTVTKQVFPFS